MFKYLEEICLAMIPAWWQFFFSVIRIEIYVDVKFEFGTFCIINCLNFVQIYYVLGVYE